ncbi:MAG: DUF3048 domain-containing protein [Acidimicrobiaceae bacterium]|nr:DUF3048 domain-containing protein [Acidimicrobiia bacterium]MCY4494035.1 DUF3048 domain-containing protein [Acidimicrobiaceae bacterium]
MRTLLLAAVALSVLLVAACLDGGSRIEANGPAAEPEPEPVFPSASVSAGTAAAPELRTSTTTLVEGPLAPFTGLPAADAAAARGPAVAVKVGNNNDQSRPQVGLAEADIVFEELIEGLKTRFLAVFQSQTPPEVGPVRSARTTDVDLLAGLGAPALAFSGANTVTLGELREAVNRGVFVDAGALRLLDPYSRLNSRSAPYNLWVDMEMIESLGAGVPAPIVVHGELPEGAGSAVGGVEVAYEASFGRRVSHLWDPATAGWVRVQDGTLHTVLRDGAEVEVAPANVVVVQIVYGVSPADPASPEAKSFNTGPVQVFTRGRVVEGTWSRSVESPAWDLRGADGGAIALAPGTTWFILAAADGSSFSRARITALDTDDAAAVLEAARADAALKG